MKSECISSYTGKPRSCYDTYEEAQNSADYMHLTKGLCFYPYKCNRCGFYHLALERDRIKLSEEICDCTDSNGYSKNLYATYEDALKAKFKAEQQRDVELEIYRCPECDGWHLTHKVKYVETIENKTFDRDVSGCLPWASCFIIAIGLAMIYFCCY